MNCKICFENYDLNEHKPMIAIPCGHSSEKALFSSTIPILTADQEQLKNAFSYDELTNLLSVRIIILLFIFE